MQEKENKPYSSLLPLIDTDIAEIAQARYLSSSPTYLQNRIAQLSSVNSNVTTLIEGGQTPLYKDEYIRAGLYSLDCIASQLKRNGSSFPPTRERIPLFQDTIRFTQAIEDFLTNEPFQNPALFAGLTAIINFQTDMLMGTSYEFNNSNQQLNGLGRELKVIMMGGFVLPPIVYSETLKQWEK